MPRRSFGAHGVVLSTRLSGEADLWVTLLSPDVGLLRALAKNALRSQKRFMGALGPLTDVEVLLGGYGGVWYLEEALVTATYGRLKRIPSAYALGCYASESIPATHPESIAAQEAYPLLAEFLELLDSGPTDLPLARLAWDLRLCLAMGLPPCVDDCTVCSRPVAASPPFDGRTGGVVCEQHDPGNSLKLSPAAIALIRHLSESSFAAIGAVPFAPRPRKLARAAIDQLMTWHLPLELRSLRVLEQLSHMSTPRLAS